MAISGFIIRNCVFSIKCKKKWENMGSDMDDDDNENIKFCSDCQKEVYLCETDEELAKNIKLNRCISISKYDNPFGTALMGLIIPEG
jgi:hypothetical protein